MSDTPPVQPGTAEARPVPNYTGEVRRFEDTLYVDFWYPQVETNPSKIQIELAAGGADDIVVSYDFDRDGWVVSRTLDPPDVVGGGDDRELAFIPAWDEDDDE